jgi:hypothetical protein
LVKLASEPPELEMATPEKQPGSFFYVASLQTA